MKPFIFANHKTLQNVNLTKRIYVCPNTMPFIFTLSSQKFLLVASYTSTVIASSVTGSAQKSPYNTKRAQSRPERPWASLQTAQPIPQWHLGQQLPQKRDAFFFWQREVHNGQQPPLASMQHGPPPPLPLPVKQSHAASLASARCAWPHGHTRRALRHFAALVWTLDL